MHVLHNWVVHLNWVIEAISNHRNLSREYHLPSFHLIMISVFTSFSIREKKLPWEFLLTLGKTLAIPASPWTPSSPPWGAACTYCSKTARNREEKTFSSRNLFITPISGCYSTFFIQFPLDIDLKSINPVVSKALTLSPLERSSLSPLELVRFSFKYSSGKLQVTSLPEPCNPRHKSEPTEIEKFFLKERK